MSRAQQLVDRITDYLNGGGLFNPELADHQAVRLLLIECRDELARESDERYLYNEQYDCFYDNISGEWTESKCSDPTCSYCTNRPEKAF